MDSIDVEIGQRIKRRRVILGFSQKQLGQKIGVSFQQIQKYENGANRISASRLYHITRILEMQIGHFFDEMQIAPQPSFGSVKETRIPMSDEKESQMRGQDKEIEELLDIFKQIRAPHVRRQIINLVRTIRDVEQGDKN